MSDYNSNCGTGLGLYSNLPGSVLSGGAGAKGYKGSKYEDEDYTQMTTLQACAYITLT